jgi:hypothetical protein
MKRIMVRYRVKADLAGQNEEYIRAVFAELEQAKPAGLRYASFKLDDGVSFVHIASIETADGSNPLLAISAFKSFSAQIKDRCEELPVTMPLHEVGNYRLVGDV